MKLPAKNFLFLKKRQLNSSVSDFEIKVLGLESHFNEGKIGCESIVMLLYQEKVIANVLLTRTEYNWIQYDYFVNLEFLS